MTENLSQNAGPIDFGIAFVTGRTHFQEVLQTYFNNWLEHGLIENKNVRLHLFVIYDVDYFNTRPADYRNIPPTVSQLIESANFYGRRAIDAERRDLVNMGMIDDAEGELLFGEGYAKKRNAALYFAKKKGMDRLLFIDDDEYPLAVTKDEQDDLTWAGQSIVGTHLKYSSDADITHGRHCGYISPIPTIRCDDNLTEADLRMFIEAISNDIVTWETVKRTTLENKGVTYAQPQAGAAEVKEISGMKFISGANLCFNLNRLQTPPVFYNPPGARGEDAFMSTTLTDHRVLRVPCYTFHDGFLEYQHLLTGVLPVRLQGVDPHSPAIRQRFIKATLGWVRYKPLLTYITQRSRYEAVIGEMNRKLELTIPKLCKYFRTTQFEQILTELHDYDQNVQQHFDSFCATRKAWAKLNRARKRIPNSVTPSPGQNGLINHS